MEKDNVENEIKVEGDTTEKIEEKVQTENEAQKFESGKLYVFGYNRKELRKKEKHLHPLLFGNFLKNIINDGFDILNVYEIGEEVTIVVKKQ